jgi:hypothetical protein
MKLGALVMVLLSNDGYWFGGSQATVGFQWTMRDAMPAAEVSWRLHAADVTLAQGQSPLANDGPAAQSRIALPRVRVPMEAELVWQVEPADHAKPHKILDQGKVSIHLYPPSLLASQATLLAGKQVFVWDDGKNLTALLTKEHLTVQTIGNESQLAFTRPDILIVAADRMSEATTGQPQGQSFDAAGQQRVMNLAAAGVSVLVLSQSGRGATDGGTSPNSRQLLGYSLTKRQFPRKLEWRENHPLSADLQLSEKSTSASGAKELDPAAGSVVWALRVPADDPALKIAWWPAEVAEPEVLRPEGWSRRSVTTDALVLTKRVGKGRLTLCQIPLGPWQSDPRSQLFLADAFDYFLSPVVDRAPSVEQGRLKSLHPRRVAEAEGRSR